MSGIGNQIQGPTTNPAQEWQISNVLSKSAGRHLLKVGGEFRRGVDDFDLGFFFVGRFVFNGTYTGDSFADFLLGRAVEFNHAKGRTKLAMRNQNFGAFFQDDIKVRDNLTAEPRRALRLLQPDYRRARPDVHVRRPAARQRDAAERRRRGDHRRAPTGCPRTRPISPTRTTSSPGSASRGTSSATAGWRCAAAAACFTTSCATTWRCSTSCPTRSRSSRSTATRRWRIRSSRSRAIRSSASCTRPTRTS